MWVSAASAQSVVVNAPAGDTLRTATPRFTLQINGFGSARPLQITFQIADNPTFSGPLLVDTAFQSNSTSPEVQVMRMLPPSTTVYWRASVTGPDGTQALSSTQGPRRTLPWLTLLRPNSPTGDQLDTRRPAFVWRSPAIVPAVGNWRFDFSLLTVAGTEFTATLLNDTVFIPPADLQANTSYRWSVRATAPGGEEVEEESAASFLIVDPRLPTTTILYQNFPNPFPSEVAFSTCFWFDVGEDGARISLDILDVRGNHIKTIIPGPDNVQEFRAGRYGRGVPGIGNNCDNRFVWNGTDSDGRPVLPGVYLLRFIANNGRPEFRRVVFRGR